MDGTTTNNQTADANAASQAVSQTETLTTQQSQQASTSASVNEGQDASGKKEDGAQKQDMEQIRVEWEKEKAAAVEAAVQEAAKKAAMKPEEAEKYEEEKRKEALEKREREIQLREMKNDTKDILHEKEIPVSFADFLLGEDMVKTKENIAVFKKEFDAAVQAQVEQRFKGTTPRVSSGIIGSADSMAAEIDRYL